CKILGVVFLLVGLIGFFVAPSQSPGGDLMGFGLNLSHNLVHILSGVLALWFGFAGETQARMFSYIFAAVYGLVAILGFIGVGFAVNLLNLNMADNWLHVILAL